MLPCPGSSQRFRNNEKRSWDATLGQHWQSVVNDILKTIVERDH
jgi:hypothetical protein